MTKKGNPIFTCLNCGSSFTNQRGYSMHIVNTKYCYNYYSQPGHNLSKFQHIKDLEFLKTPKAASLNYMNDKSTMQPSSLLAGDNANDNNSISTGNSQSSFQDFPNCDDDDSDDSLHSQNSIMSEIVINHDDTVKGPPIHLFTEDRLHEIKLMEILQEMNAPNYAFEQIMTWARNAYSSGFNFNPENRHYNGQIQRLEKWFGFSGSLRPKNNPVKLQFDEFEVPVITFDFTAQLLSLFQDSELNQMENLVVNPTDPFEKYDSPDGYLGEVNTGDHYQIAYAEMITNPDTDFLCPIIMYMDETTVSLQSQITCHPVMFTTTIFNRQQRNQSHCWRVLGYVPILKYYYSATSSKKKMTKAQKSLRRHQMLYTILESFIEAQKPGALDSVRLTLGGKTKTVNLKVPLFYIIGDIKGGDEIAGRNTVYNSDAKRISRTCNAGPDLYGCCDIDCCQPLVMSEIQEMFEQNRFQEMKDLFQFEHDNAFFHVSFGGEPGGIFTAACPIEGLHCIENGIMMHCLDEIFGAKNPLLPPKAQMELDEAVIRWTTYPKQRLLQGGYGKELPRLRFEHGITTLSNTSAAHKVGAMLAVVLVALTGDGRNTFLRLVRRKDERRKDEVAMDIVYSFEMLLCFWAWLKKDKYWKQRDHASFNEVRRAVSKLMSELQENFKRTKGAGWFIPKLHELLHIANNIRLWGAHSNVHSGPQEHNHIANVKRPGKRTQKLKSKFDFQLASRMYEKSLISRAFRVVSPHVKAAMTNEEEADNVNQVSKQSSKYIVSIHRNTLSNQVILDYQWTTKQPELDLPEGFLSVLPDFFLNDLSVEEQYLGIELKGFTEYNRHGKIFRAHPDYRNEGPWNDFAMIAWSKDTDSTSTTDMDTDGDHHQETLNNAVRDVHNNLVRNAELVPARILGFVQDCDDEVYVIIHSCYENSKTESVLTRRWLLEFEEDNNTFDASLQPGKDRDDMSDKTPLIRCVNVDCIERHCLMIPYHDKSHFLIELLPQEQWSDKFVVW